MQAHSKRGVRHDAGTLFTRRRKSSNRKNKKKEHSNMSAYVYLGSLSVAEIESRYGFTFTDDERKFMEDNWHRNAEFEHGDSGWHMFDIPEIIFLSDDEVGHHIFNILCNHNARNEIQGSFGVAFEKD